MLFAWLAVPAFADDLVGRALPLVDQGENALELLIVRIGLDDEDKVSGEIKSVAVEQSNERTAQLKVAFTGYQGAELEAEVLDGDKRRIRNIKPAEYVVAAAADGVEQSAILTFELDDNTDEGFETRSTRVKLSVKKRGKRTVQHLFTYLLDKKWEHAISAENRVVRVKPMPIGRTAQWVSSLTRPQPARPLVVQPLAVQPALIRHSVALDSSAVATLAKRGTTTATVKPQLTLATSARINTAEALRNKNFKAIERLPTQYAKVAITDYRFAQAKPKSETSTEPSNQVNNMSVDLMSLLQAEDGVDFELSEILGVARNVYPDANPNSGVFYYVPRAYKLSYNSELGGGKGLGFRITYDRRREGDDSDSVRMAASFNSAVDLKEIQLAERILSAVDRGDSSFTFKGPLKPFPLVAPPQFDFSGALAGHVDSDKIAVVALSDTLEGIDVSWSTDAISAQNIRRDLRDGTPLTGIAGFDPPGDNAPRLAMPARVDVTDPDVYQAVKWSRADDIRNNSPLPIILKYVHALVIEGNRPRLYSWDLHETRLPATSKLDLDLQHLPVNVDQKAERLWIQYGLDRTCDTCIDAVVDTLLSGDVWPDTGTITLRSLTPLSDTGAAEIWADVRSRFFDPSDREIVDGPQQTITEDRGVYQIDPVFLTNRRNPETDEAWPLFEYRLTVIMSDGAMHAGEAWIASERDTVIVGPVQIAQSLGYVPGAE